MSAQKHRANLILPLALITILLAVGITSFWPIPSAFGFNHLTYYPTGVAVTLWVLVLVSMLPRIRRRLAVIIIPVLESLIGRRRKLVVIQLGLAIGFAALCVVFRSAAPLWGDTELMASIAEKAVYDYESVVEGIRVAIIKTPRASGAAVVHAVVGQLGAAAGLTVRDTIAIWHALLGGLYVFITLRIIAQLKLHVTSQVWIVVLLYTSGAMMLFFGYTEVYTLPYLFATVVALTSHKYLDGNGSLAVPVVMTVIAIALNIQAALLLASLCFLLLRRRGTGTHTTRRIATVILVTTVVAGIGLQFVIDLSEYYRPFLGGGGELKGQSSPFIISFPS